MKTRTNATLVEQANAKKALKVRTELTAGRSCHTYDSSCRSRQGHYDNCGGKIPGDGTVCFAANLAAGVPFKDAVCEAC